MTLAEQLKDIAEQNRLDGLSVHISVRPDGSHYFNAFAHASGLCGGSNGGGKSGPSEAIASAITNLNKKRTAGASVPSLVAA